MTSGQMAPTTLVGQVTTTSPFGRKPEIEGYPVNVCEMLATLKGSVFVERVSTHDIKNLYNTKKAIKKAFQVQMAGLGFSIVEVLSTCPTNGGWNRKGAEMFEEKMIPQYPPATSKERIWRCRIWHRLTIIIQALEPGYTGAAS
jgi:2-oxoglutarate ferredoxin oxidoreductase subunit beta